MMPEEKKPSTTKNFETFDLWSTSQFAMWSNVRYDFELVAEITRYRKSTRKCLELIDTVNGFLKNPPERVFFDGTIRCLKYLIKNKYLVLSDLPTLTQDEKYLLELLEKYSKRLDITEVIADIEEPTLRVMLIEYPHLISEVLKGNPIAQNLVSKAMLKNGITDADSFVKKVDNPTDFIEVSADKDSKEAMRCKLIYIGLRLIHGKLQIVRTAVETIKAFETLTDDAIENETYSKSIFNAMYAVFYGSDDWNNDRRTHLSGCDTLYLDFQLLFLPDNHMSLIYDIFLKEEVDRIGKKYFGEAYRPEGFVASLAIKMVVVIILFRAENFIPKGEKADIPAFSAGAMLGSMNYAVEEAANGQYPLRLKKWFIDYFRSELDKRIAFIKMQIENNVAVVNMDKPRVIYLPVFESFRFFCSKHGLLEQIIRLLKNKSIPNSIKDDIFINFTNNIQKVINDKQASKDENYFKDTFILLIVKTFENLIKKTVGSLNLNSPTKSYYKNDYIKDDLFGDANKINHKENDLFSDATVAIMELIWNFDLSKCDSFIGYLSHNLYLKIKTSSRIKKSEQCVLEHELEEGFLENIPNENDFIKELDNQVNLVKIQQYIDNLPEKQKEAIRKLYEKNERLSNTERKNKNRGLNKIREMAGMS